MSDTIKAGAADYVSKVYNVPISDAQRTEVERAFFAGVLFGLTRLVAAESQAATAVALFAELRRFAKAVEREAHQQRWDAMKKGKRNDPNGIPGNARRGDR